MHMKAQLILISHGHFAEEVLKTAELIVGNVENAQAISMSMEEGGEGLRKKVNAAFQGIDHNSHTIIIVDIISGTPCNIAVENMYERENVKVISGLNLGMVIEYAVSSEEDTDKLVSHLVESAKEITKVIEKETIAGGEYED